MLANGTVKSMPPSYCIWCEEKLAVKQWFPHCSSHCKKSDNRSR